MDQIFVQRVRETGRVQEIDSQGSVLAEAKSLLDRVRNRAFELFERRGGATGHEMDDWLVAEREFFEVPNARLSETDGEFQLQVAMPGFEDKDIHVAALPNAVIVEAESSRQAGDRNQTVYFSEFGRHLFRHIPLPKPADVEHVSASLDNGILRIRVAKAEAATQAS